MVPVPLGIEPNMMHIAPRTTWFLRSELINMEIVQHQQASNRQKFDVCFFPFGTNLGTKFPATDRAASCYYRLVSA